MNNSVPSNRSGHFRYIQARSPTLIIPPSLDIPYPTPAQCETRFFDDGDEEGFRGALWPKISSSGRSIEYLISYWGSPRIMD